MKPSDTSPEASKIYFRLLGEMTPSERINLGAALWAVGDALQRAAIRQICPDATDAEINFRISVTRFGPELARKAHQRQ
jgi:hypothetical protein